MLLANLVIVKEIHFSLLYWINGYWVIFVNDLYKNVIYYNIILVSNTYHLIKLLFETFSPNTPYIKESKTKVRLSRLVRCHACNLRAHTRIVRFSRCDKRRACNGAVLVEHTLDDRAVKHLQEANKYDMNLWWQLEYIHKF